MLNFEINPVKHEVHAAAESKKIGIMLPWSPLNPPCKKSDVSCIVHLMRPGVH